MGERAAVVGGEHDERVLLEAGGLQRREHLADAIIEVLDERDVQRAFPVHGRRASLHAREPLGGRLHRKMRGVVGEVEKEGRLRGGALAQIIARPRRENIRGVSDRIDDLAIAAHIIVTLAAVRRVAVHHVVEEAVEKIEAAVVRRAGRGEAEVPLADDRGVVAGRAQVICDRRHVGIEVAPRIGRIGTDEAGHADAVRVTAAHQRGARRRTHSGIGAHAGEPHPFRRETIEVGRLHIRSGAIGRHVADAQIVGENDDDVGPDLRSRRAAREKSDGDSGKNQAGGESLNLHGGLNKGRENHFRPA